MVSFIHNGSEITTWMGIASKPKVQNLRQSNIFKKRTSFLNLKLQIIRLPQGHWSYTPTNYNSYFCSCTYEKNIFSSSFYQRVFFCQFVDRNVVGLMPKYYLLAGDTSQIFIFFSLHKIKISKQHRFIL